MNPEDERKYFKLDFIGIGAPKCATTWIFECLREHPEVFVISLKTEPLATYFLDPIYQKGLRHYSSFFNLADSNQVKGEFTDFYLENKDVAFRIKNHNPKMKIIVCIRNPMQRAWSQYLHRIYVTNMKWSSFEEAIEKDSKIIVDRGFYYKQLQTYYESFPKSQIMTLVTDYEQPDPLKVIQEIYAFLNVDKSFISQSAFLKISPTRFKITKLGRMIYKISPWIKNNRFASKIQQLKVIKTCFYRFADFYGSRIDSAQQMKEQTRQYLKDIYRNDTQNLEKLIGRDLSHWK